MTPELEGLRFCLADRAIGLLRILEGFEGRPPVEEPELMVDEIMESDIGFIEVGTEEARKVEDDVVRFRRGGATIGVVCKEERNFVRFMANPTPRTGFDSVERVESSN